MGTGRKIILVICLIVFVGSAGVLLDYFINGMREQNALEGLKDMQTDREDLVTDKGTVIGKYADLYLANSDIIGWVTVDDTHIDYPVMQTQDDPEFYLHRGFDKEYAASGVPFMDAASDIFVPTSNFLIYGHNMKNGTMFHDLLEYDSKDFFEEHPTFKFDTIYKGGQGTYQVIAAGYTQIYRRIRLNSSIINTRLSRLSQNSMSICEGSSRCPHMIQESRRNTGISLLPCPPALIMSKMDVSSL